MPGASLIPIDAPGEHDDVADLLSIARVTWNRGDHAAAVSFVQRAAQTAMELELEPRGLELAKVAAELKASVSQAPAPPEKADGAAAAPSTAARAIPSAVQTPPLVLTPSRPPHQTLPGIQEASADRAAIEPPPPEAMEDEPATIPLPDVKTANLSGTGGVLTLSSDDLDEEPKRDTSIDVPPAHALVPPIKVGMRSPTPPPATTSAAPPRPAASAAPRPLTPSGRPPPPLPSHRPPAVSVKPSPLASTTSQAPAPTNGAGRPSTSPTPPKVSPSVRPPAVAPVTSATSSASRAPLPLRVKTNEEPARAIPPAAELPRPPEMQADGSVTGALPSMVQPSVEPSAVRRSVPWMDEVTAPLTASGGAPVILGIRARIHFHTDGTLELGPDGEGTGGLAVVILPQKGDDMSTLLKRLSAKKR